MNQPSRNRYLLTARSLMPDTLLMMWLLPAGLVGSITCSVIFRLPATFTFFALTCSLMLGHMTCLYKKSERRRLVPGMNEVCAAVVLAIACGAWLLNCFLFFIAYGFVPEAYGISLFLIALGLWIGWGERRVLYFFGALFIVMLGIMVIPRGPLKVYYFYMELGSEMRSLLGLGLGIGGCCVLARFWNLVVSKIDSVTFKRNDYLFFLKRKNQNSNDEGIAASAEAMPLSLATRASWMLYGRPYLTSVHLFWFGLGLFGILTVLLSSRGNVTVAAAFACLAAGTFVLIPSIMMINRVPQSLSRLWLTGLEDNRTATARYLLNLTLRRTFPILATIVMLLLLQAPFELNWYATMLFALLVGTCVSGIVFWLTAKSYVFCSNNPTLMSFLAFPVIALMFGSLISFSAELIRQLGSAINDFGPISALLAIVWSMC